MDTSPKQDDALLVAHQGACAFVCVQGRGTFKNGPSLRSFGNDALEKGARNVIFDMAKCETMDSTFMGVMAGLAMRVRRLGTGKVFATNLSPKTVTLLRQLGLDRVVECHEVGAPWPPVAGLTPEVPLQGLPSGPARQEISIDTMLTAHEDLVRACSENLPKFTDVITYLKEAKEKGSGR